MTFGRYHPSESTIIGIATILGTISGLLTHELNTAGAVPLIVGALISILIPGNAGAKIAGEKAASQIAAAIQDKSPAPMVAAALAAAGTAFTQSVEQTTQTTGDSHAA